MIGLSQAFLTENSVKFETHETHVIKLADNCSETNECEYSYRVSIAFITRVQPCHLCLQLD